jgi:hypothetical protein
MLLSLLLLLLLLSSSSKLCLSLMDITNIHIFPCNFRNLHVYASLWSAY